MISSKEAQRRIAEADANVTRLDSEDQQDHAALEKALTEGGDTSKIEARLTKRAAERPGILARRAAAVRVLATAEAAEAEDARLARIEAIMRERKALHADERARAAKVADALRTIEEHEGPRRRAMAEDQRLAEELRRLKATDVPEPIGIPFERLIEPRWNSNALAAERVEITIFSSCDPAETSRLAAYSASRNAATMAQASGPRPQPVTRRAPPPAPMVSLDDELDGIDAA